MIFVRPKTLVQSKRIFISSGDAYELSEYHPNGKIKFKVIAFSNSSEGLKYAGLAEYFDEKGNVIKTETYDSQGNLMK